MGKSIILFCAVYVFFSSTMNGQNRYYIDQEIGISPNPNAPYGSKIIYQLRAGGDLIYSEMDYLINATESVFFTSNSAISTINVSMAYTHSDCPTTNRAVNISTDFCLPTNFPDINNCLNIQSFYFRFFEIPDINSINPSSLTEGYCETKQIRVMEDSECIALKYAVEYYINGNFNDRIEYIPYGKNPEKFTYNPADIPGLNPGDFITFYIRYTKNMESVINNENYSSPLRFGYILCSPKLKSIFTTNETCINSNNGSVSLIFDKNVDISNGYRMRYFLYDANADIEFDPAKENPPQTIEQEILDELFPQNDGTGQYRGTLPVGLSYGHYKIVYQEFYDMGNGTDVIIKSGGVTAPFTIDRPGRVILNTSAPDFFKDATCGNPAILTLDDTASGGDNINGSGKYSYEYSLDNGNDWTIINDPDNILKIPAIADVQSLQIRGVYTVDGNDCPGEVYQYHISAIVPPIIFADPSTGTPSTLGAMDGSVRVEFSGGTFPYTYALSQLDTVTGIFDPISANPFPVRIPNGTAVTFNGLPAGNFSIEVTDAHGCAGTITAIIDQPEVLVANIVQTLSLDCNGGDYAEITASVHGGLPPYAYTWYQIIDNNNNVLSEDTEIIGDLSSGTYFLRLSDSNNNTVDSTPLTIAQPDPLIAKVEQVTDVSCTDGADGAVSIAISGGTEPYSYMWSNSNTTRNLKDVKAGHYTLEVLDANACRIEVAVTIDSPGDTIRIVDATVNHISEYGSRDGNISLTLSGGTAPYTINWVRLSDNTIIGNQTTISELSADIYQIIATDSNGCSTTEKYRITQPDIVEQIIVPPTCWNGSNGRITILVNQGNGNYTYNWDTGENTNTITDLAAGNYRVTINGLGDGPVTRTYTVEAPPPPLIDLERNRTICKGQDLVLDAKMEDNSATYSWTSNTGFISNRPSVLVNMGGTYTITVTSGKGCSITETVFVDSSHDEINAEFAMSSQIFLGDPLIAVDISFPLPESLEWIIPDAATVLKQDSDEIGLLFNEAGEYEIGIITKIGDCIAQQFKKVLVTTNDNMASINENKASRTPIQDFLLHPNPTNGRFTADILLPETGPISVKVFNFANNALMATEKVGRKASYSIALDLSGRPAGIYAVVLETPFGNALQKIILN